MWKIVIIVIVGLMILGAFMSIGEYLIEHKLVCAAGAIVFILFFLSGRKAALSVLLLIVLGTIVYTVLLNTYKSNNEKKLKKYLEMNCKSLGYMDIEMWKAELPTFVALPYKDTFFGITTDFARAQERLFFSETKLRAHYKECRRALDENKGAITVEALLPMYSEFLRTTHSSEDYNIINKLVEQLCKEDDALRCIKLKDGKTLLTREGKVTTSGNMNEVCGSCNGEATEIETEQISLEELMG
ncbi:hypothetical protein [Clostridium transplantifaecale]|uniref:hypothetical protein n=1 Tax=Clostridium transplantifaecale TaxID=2479838 RepID=UPI000F63A237|nr:hypothetical protein [Clostridium transplantifaecale]